MVDILVHGEGPVGCTFALALAGSGHTVAFARPVLPETVAAIMPTGYRPIALSYASRLILERLGIWPELQATPIDSIHVSQQGGFGRTVFDARDTGVPALGYVTEYSALAKALRGAASAQGIGHASPTEASRSLRCDVHAEGRSPEASEKRYQQDALVALVHLAAPSRGVAFERFTAEGPLALLPDAGRYAVVWSTRPDRAQALQLADERSFLGALREAIGTRVAVPRSVERRSVQPLALRVRAARVLPRAVYIGNAAQTLHPVAGQGLNLGLRDAWDLAQTLRSAADPGDAEVLARYAARRRVDAAATIRVTDALAGGFTGESRIVRLARGFALTALDVLPAPRRFFARRMVFGPSALP